MGLGGELSSRELVLVDIHLKTRDFSTHPVIWQGPGNKAIIKDFVTDVLEHLNIVWAMRSVFVIQLYKCFHYLGNCTEVGGFILLFLLFSDSPGANCQAQVQVRSRRSKD